MKERLRARRKVWSALAVCGCLLGLPSIAHAQSAIAGTVKDSSGAVLPGVTVEAASDVLIEKSRVVVSDSAGRYNIVDLRPGTYVVTFTLTGFQTVKREGLELPAQFTATVDATMTVGAVEESVTVSGASPVVDVQSNAKTQTLPRDVLDSVPNAHTIQSVGQLVPGVTLSAPDVGGSQQMQQTYFSVHGANASQTSVLIDGMAINSPQADGAIQSYFTTAGSQEMVYQTGGGGGESPTGGLTINMVPREGGNRFSGSSSLGFNQAGWQSNNFTSALQAQGVTSVDKIGNYRDFDVTQGGPIKKDRLWFFLVGRAQASDKPVANTTVTPPNLIGNPTAMAAALAACRASVGSCPQGVSPERIDSALGRLTMQVTSKNKLSLYLDRIHKDRAAAQGAGDDQTQTAIHWTSPDYATDYAKWTSTLSNRLLLEGGWSSTIERYNNYYEAGIEQPLYSPLWYTMAARNDATDGLYSVAPSGESRQYPDRYYGQGSVSYVTGSHNVKLGGLLSWDEYNIGEYHNADLIQNYTNIGGGVLQPSTATLEPTDARWNNKLKAGSDVYLQDSWTLKHLTLTGGIRWDYVQEAVVGQPVQAGRFETIPAFSTIDLPKQTNWSPTIAGVWDVTGNGKTAIRAGYRHFVAAAADSLAGLYQVGNGNTQSVAWTDLNSDNVVQWTPGCVYKTAGCELNMAPVPANFGAENFQPVNQNLTRPYYSQYNVGIVREIAHGISGTVEWFRTNTYNLQTTQNEALGLPNGVGDPTQNPNFRAVNIVNPLTGSSIVRYDYASLAAAQTAVQNVTFNNTGETMQYNGVDVNLNARLPHGLRIFGGTTTERTLTNTCDLGVYNPNNLLYCDQSNLGGGFKIPWITQVKVSGTYPLPVWGLILNGTMQNYPGYALASSTFTLSAATNHNVVCPGTSAGSGCVVGQPIVAGLINPSLSVPLTPASAQYTPRYTDLDMGLEKRLKFGRLSVLPRFDVYNVFNSSAYYAVQSTAFSPVVGPSGPLSAALPANKPGTNYTTYLAPARFLDGRIFRIGFNLAW